MIQLLGERRGERAFAMAAILAVSRYVAVPAAVVVGVTGLYQLVRGPFGLGDVWLATALVLYLAVLAIATGYLAPAYARAGRAASDEEYAHAIRRVNVVGPLVAAAVVAIAVLMVVKP